MKVHHKMSLTLGLLILGLAIYSTVRENPIWKSAWPVSVILVVYGFVPDLRPKK